MAVRKTAVLRIVFDGGFDRNAIGVRFVGQLIDCQTELLCLPGDRVGLSSHRCGLLCVALNRLILPGAVANANIVGDRSRPL